MFTSARTLIAHSAALIITALSVAPWANTALAGPPTSRSVVQYRDLDLSTDAGVQALYERIKTAAKRVCFRETSAVHVIDLEARYVACYKDTVADAVKQIGQTRLTAIHAQSRLARN